MSRLSLVLGFLAVLLAAVAAPASGAVRQGPAGTAFYTPPSPLPGAKHGDVIWWRTQRGSDALAGAGSNRLLLYRSQGVAGTVAVSGSVAVPKGTPPKGGWPVITWAHGTTGIADQCAPTRDGRLTSYIHPLLQRWLKRGYAVVRTDYEGLGTPAQVHPYLIGPSEGRGVLDIARAARKLDRRLGRNVVIAGHSQGGQAALFAASLAPAYTPELKVRGTDAFAPASHLGEQLPLVVALQSPSPAYATYAMMVSRGLDLARPALGVTRTLSDDAASRYGQVDAVCQSALLKPGAFGDIAPATLFRAGTDFAPFVAALEQLDDPENLRIRTPVRIDQGAADATVFPAYSQQTADAYRKRGTKVTYETYKGVGHGEVPLAAATKATAWIEARLR